MKRWIYLILGCVLLVSVVISFINVIALGLTAQGVVSLLWQVLWGVFGIVFLSKAIRLFMRKETKKGDKENA